MSRDPADTGVPYQSDLGADASGLSGRDLGEPGSMVDHVLKPQHAQVEGAPLSEEREEPETHDHVSMEHIAAGPPLIPHETMEQQRAEEDAD